jgi:hypothetical protein
LHVNQLSHQFLKKIYPLVGCNSNCLLARWGGARVLELPVLSHERGEAWFYNLVFVIFYGTVYKKAGMLFKYIVEVYKCAMLPCCLQYMVGLLSFSNI